MSVEEELLEWANGSVDGVLVAPLRGLEHFARFDVFGD